MINILERATGHALPATPSAIPKKVLHDKDTAPNAPLAASLSAFDPDRRALSFGSGSRHGLFRFKELGIVAYWGIVKSQRCESIVSGAEIFLVMFGNGLFRKTTSTPQAVAKSG
jgi:hypothetical protein